jgi:predicted Zn finger-like uncharacterized protein
MIVTCPNCSTRLQLDQDKLPARPFSVRCPKCQQIVNAPPAAPQAQTDARSAFGDVPAPNRPQQETSAAPAPPPVREEPTAEAPSLATRPAASAEGEVMRLLASLLQREPGEAGGLKGAPRRPAWERRRALVCVDTVYAASIARALTDGQYEVFIAPDAPQALERMREERVEVVVLDAEFDMTGQGSMLVSREIVSMRMPERRRVVFVQFSNTTRTGDTHAAFLADTNLFVNAAEVGELPRALEKNVRDLNELYRDFNKALNLTEL